MLTKRNVLLYGLVLAVAVVLAAVAGYGLGTHLSHVREVEKAEKFYDAALDVSIEWFNVYAKTGDDAAYWKAVSAFGTYVSIYEQFADEDSQRSEVMHANVRVFHRLLSLLYSHEKECKAEVESLKTLLIVHGIHPYGLWPGDMQDVQKFERFCDRIEAAAKE